MNEGKNAAKIYKDKDIIKYIRFWESEIVKLEKELSKIELSNLADLPRRLKRFKVISQTIGEFCELLRRIHHTHPNTLKASQYKEILERLTYVEINPLNLPQARNYYGQAIATFDLKKRIEFLNKSLDLYPHFFDSLKERGLTNCNLGNYDQSLIDLNKAIQIAPGDWTLFIGRGITYKCQNQFDKALADFYHSIELYEFDALAYNDIADVYRRLNDFEKATFYAEKAIALEPELEWTWSTFAEICAGRNDKDGFYSNMKKAVVLGFPLFRYLSDSIYDEYLNDASFKEMVEKSKLNDKLI
ncbi:MAG TPA: tetratricopeptide repeat protein [Mucilaginibacter sp.]